MATREIVPPSCLIELMRRLKLGTERVQTELRRGGRSGAGREARGWITDRTSSLYRHRRRTSDDDDSDKVCRATWSAFTTSLASSTSEFPAGLIDRYRLVLACTPYDNLHPIVATHIVTLRLHAVQGKQYKSILSGKIISHCIQNVVVYDLLYAIRTFMKSIDEELKVKKINDCTNTGNKS